jgi:hypothetical protein
MKLSKYQISLILTIISLVIWSYGIICSNLDIGFFGLISSFSLWFFIALGFLFIAAVIAWNNDENHNSLLVLQTLILILSFWLIPLLIGGSQPVEEHVRDKFIENVIPILQNGYLNFNATWYHQWPGTWIEGVSLMQILGLTDSGPLIFLAPFVLQVFFSISFYAFLKRIIPNISKSKYWVAIWVFLLANWLEQNYFGPQAFGLLIIMLLLLLLANRESLVKEDNSTVNNRRWISIIILFFLISLILTHLLSALVGIAVILFTTILGRNRNNFTIFMIAVAAIIAWTLYQTTSFFSSQLPFYIDRAFRIDLTLSTDIFKHGLTGSESHHFIGLTRILLSGLFLLIFVYGVICSYKTRPYMINHRFLWGVAIAILLTGFSGVYSMELTQRIFFFALPIIAYIGIVLFENKFNKYLLFIILMICVPLHLIAQYGNQRSDYISPSYMAGREYLFSIDAKTFFPYFQLGSRYDSYAEDDAPLSNIINGDFIYNIPFSPFEMHYFFIAEKNIDEYEFLSNNSDFIIKIWSLIDGSSIYNHIYSGGEFCIYVGQEPVNN